MKELNLGSPKTKIAKEIKYFNFKNDQGEIIQGVNFIFGTWQKKGTDGKFKYV